MKTFIYTLTTIVILFGITDIATRKINDDKNQKLIDSCNLQSIKIDSINDKLDKIIGNKAVELKIDVDSLEIVVDYKDSVIEVKDGIIEDTENELKETKQELKEKPKVIFKEIKVYKKDTVIEKPKKFLGIKFGTKKDTIKKIDTIQTTPTQL